jgi:hypothetical protein
MAAKNSALAIFTNFYGDSTESVFRTATSPNLTFFQLEDIIGTKTKLK